QSWGLSVVVVVDAVVVVVVVAAARRKTKFWPCADQTRTPRIRSTKITTKSHLTTCRPSPSGSHRYWQSRIGEPRLQAPLLAALEPVDEESGRGRGEHAPAHRHRRVNVDEVDRDDEPAVEALARLVTGIAGVDGWHQANSITCSFPWAAESLKVPKSVLVP